MGKYLIHKIGGLFRNPSNLIYRINSIIRHWRYPRCSAKAIIYKPLLITPRHLNLEEGVYIYANALIQGVTKYAGTKYSPKIKIGKGTSIRQNVHITCASSITIGSFCAITHNVTITDIDHTYEYNPCNYPPPIKNKLLVNDIQLGEKCMVFPNSVILGGSKIGNNCVIGANSVIRGIFPDNCVIVGAPAKIVKRYNPLSEKWEKTNPDGSFIKKLNH